MGVKYRANPNEPWSEIPALKGDQGKKGADGKTPVKGTDYWTAADKAEIVNDVLAALPAAEEVSV